MHCRMTAEIAPQCALLSEALYVSLAKNRQNCKIVSGISVRQSLAASSLPLMRHHDQDAACRYNILYGVGYIVHVKGVWHGK